MWCVVGMGEIVADFRGEIFFGRTVKHRDNDSCLAASICACLSAVFEFRYSKWRESATFVLNLSAVRLDSVLA